MNDLIIQSGDQESRVYTPFDPDKVGLVYAPSPIHFYRTLDNVAPWNTIARTLEDYGIDPDIVHVQLNADIIPQYLYEIIILKPGDIMGVKVVPEDRSALGILFQIGVVALAVVATYYGGPLAGAAVLTAGEMLDRMVIEPPQSPKTNAATTPPRYTISGDTNNIAPYATHPKVYGTAIALKPTQYGLPYTEARRRIQHLRMLLSPGCGPCDIRNIKLKNTDIAQYEEVQYDLRSGFLDDTDTTLFTNTVDPVDLNIILLDDGGVQNTTGSGPHTQTTSPNTTRIVITISALQGAGTTNDVGNTRWVKIWHHVQYALNGVDHTLGGADPTGNSAWLNRPDLVLQGETLETVHAFDDWEVDAGLYDVRITEFKVTCKPGGSLTGPNVVHCSTTWTSIESFKPRRPVNLPGQALVDLRIRATGQLNGVINDLTCDITSIEPDWDPAAIDPVTGAVGSWNAYAGGWRYDYEGAGTYTLDVTTPHTGGGKAVKITVPASGSAHIVSTTWPVRDPMPKNKQHTIVFPGEVYKSSGWFKSLTAVASGVRIRLLYGATEDFEVANILRADVVYNGAGTTSWQQATLNNTALRVPQGAKFARLEVGLTNPTGSIVVVEFDDLFSGRIDDALNGPNVVPNASFNYSGRMTSNSASHFRSVLQGTETDIDIPDSKINILALQTWHEDIIAGKYYFNGVFDHEENIDGVLDAICSVGRARKRISQDLFSVVQDKASNAVVQVWSDANLKDVTFSRDFPDLPHGFHTQFRNAAKQGAPDEVTVCDDGFSLLGPAAIANEAIFTGDGSTKDFGVAIKGGIRGWPLQPSTLSITGTALPTVTDNGSGVLAGTGVTGTVDNQRGWIVLHYTVAPGANVVIKAAYNGNFGTQLASKFENLDLSIGVTDLAQAFRDARFHLAQARLRPDLFAGTSDIEMIKCDRGDRCLMQSRLLAFGKTAGRVSALNGGGGSNLIGVSVDEPVHMDTGTTYVIRFRLADPAASDITIVAQLTNPGTGDYTDLLFTAPILAANPQPLIGYLFVFGIINADSQAVTVAGIEPIEDYNANVTFMIYDPLIFDAENRVPPATSDANIGVPLGIGIPVIDTLPDGVTPAITSAREAGTDNETGAKLACINITLKPGTIDSQFLTDHPVQVEVWYRKAGVNGNIDRGVYSAITAYAIGDLVNIPVTVLGIPKPQYTTYWIAQVASTGVNPLTDTTEATWMLVSLDNDWTKMAPLSLSTLIKITPIDVAQSYDIAIRYCTPEQEVVGQWLYIKHIVTAQDVGLDAVHEGPIYGKPKKTALRAGVPAKSVLHNFPNATLDTDGVRIDVTNLVG